jgi:signal transduction histidine kinase
VNHDALKRDDIEAVLERDRAATNESLQAERTVVDGASIEQETTARLEQTRESTSEQLSDRRDTSRGEPDASGELPEVADTLVQAAESLSEAATDLTRAAQKLKDICDPASVSALHDVTDVLADAAERISGDPAPEPVTSDTGAPAVAGKLAELAESLGVVAANLAEERLQADETLREERARIDETLAGERHEVDAALEDEREARRELLRAERGATDRDLNQERTDTDIAVEHTFNLLKQEEAAHHQTRDAIITREEFLAIVSHDLRTPLSLIAGHSRMLADMARREPLDARFLKPIDDIRKASALMGRMLSDLLDATRFERGRFQLACRTENAAVVLAECADAFDAIVRANQLTLRVETPPAPVMATFDHDRVVQVLSNLVRNAIQFTRAGGIITLAAASTPEGCRLSVADSGSGIGADDLSRIFERFHQAGNSDRRGLGLGLYISKAIIDAHGGRIWAESKPGRGSTFFFTLPH